MKERSILFKGEMVQAILEGRKTMTRRVVKHRGVIDAINEVGSWDGPGDEQAWILAQCPYGKPGDRLWVRETWQGPLFDYEESGAYQENPSAFESPKFCDYAADGGPTPEFINSDDELVCRWRPSIHMPRWASRILLEVTDVRVERLNAISEADATADGGYSPITRDCKVPKFRELWQSINGPDSWALNPWVWVVSFKRVTP